MGSRGGKKSSPPSGYNTMKYSRKGKKGINRDFFSGER